MKVDEIITELGKEDEYIAQLAMDALQHLVHYVKNETYCPSCGGVEICTDTCKVSTRIETMIDYQRIKCARQLLDVDYDIFENNYETE